MNDNNRGLLLTTMIVSILLFVVTLVLAGFLIKASLTPNMGAPLVLCILLVPGIMACDTNIILSGDQVDCVVHGVTEECTIKTQSFITLPTVGATICLTILNNHGNLLMGHLNITYEQSLAVANLGLEYWTSNREIVTASAKYCGGTQFCNAQKDCSTIKNRTTADDALYGAVTMLPGLTDCGDSCGCAACKCFQCQESCLYRRFAINPVPTIWSVRKITTSRIAPRLEVCFRPVGGEKNCTTGVFTAGASKVFGGNYSMTYLGSFQTSFDFFDHKILVSEDKTAAYFVEAAPPNLPMAGIPGEIQANSPHAFVNTNSESFIFSQDICKAYVSDSTAYFDCVAPPLNEVVKGTPLPTISDGVLWTYSSDDTLIGDVLVPPGLTFSMIGTGDLKFITTRIQVCPVLEFVEIQGVWGSPTGAKATIRGFSRCLPGKCILSTVSTKITLDSVFLDLADEEEELFVFFRSNSKEVNFELNCQSLGESASIVVEGELADPTPITPVIPGDTPDGIVGWFDGLSHAGQIGFLVGISLAGLLILALLILAICYAPVIVAFFRSCTRKGYEMIKRKKKDKKDKEVEMKVKKEEEAQLSDTESEEAQLTMVHDPRESAYLRHLREFQKGQEKMRGEN